MTGTIGGRVRNVLIRPVDVLLEEHALHRRMLTVLERIVVPVAAGAPFPASDVARLLRYFREFVEGVHHSKEDRAVYPLALSEADDQLAETVGVLVADHEETRDLLQSLMLFWEPGDLLPQERAGFCRLARTYAARMRRHMALEEKELFPFVAGMPDSEQQRALELFDEVAATRRTATEWTAVAAEFEEHWPG